MVTASVPELVVRSQRVLAPEGMRPADVWVAEGRIQELRPPGAVPAGASLEDVGDLVVLPGLVDTHVHVNEPGRTAWEGYQTATRAAAVGGITTIVDMPLNCIPVTTTRAALEAKLEALEGKLHVDCAFWGGVIPGGAADLEDLARGGIAGAKAFMIHSGIDDFPASGAEDLRAGMRVLARHGLPLLAHAELCAPGEDQVPLAAPRRYRSFLESRPPRWEVDAVELLVTLMRETGCRVHVVHLAAADALDAVRAARAEGLPLTVETCPHYLTLSAEAVEDGQTPYKCCPPIREEENRERLWAALGAGDIDMVVSDHSPCTPDLKLLDEGDFERAWGGIASLQFGLSVLWTQARARRHGLEDLARWMCAAPARLAGLEGTKGALVPGADADLVVFDPDEAFVLREDMIRHRHKLTPYLGRRLEGTVVRTYLRGTLLHQRGEPRGEAHGRPLRGAARGAC